MKKISLLLTLLVSNVINSEYTYVYGLDDANFENFESDTTVPVNKNEQLLQAVTKGNKSLIQSLLKLPEVNKDTKDNEGRTPLMIASFMAQFKASKCGYGLCNNDCGIEIVKLLLEAGCDVNATDLENNTALYYACLNANYDVVNILLKHKAQISKEIVEYVKSMEKTHGSVNSWNKKFHVKKERLYSEIDTLFYVYLNGYH